MPTQVKEEEGEGGRRGLPPIEDIKENSRQDSGEPFDPFHDGGDESTWNDPGAYYDQAPPARPAPVSAVLAPWEREGEEREGEALHVGDDVGTKLNSHEQKEDGLGDMGGDEDCTGSAYMDTTQFLRTNMPMCGRHSPQDPCFSTDETLGLPFTDESEDADSTPTGGVMTSGECGQYDFPTALASFPVNSRDGPAKRDVGDEGHDTRAGQYMAYYTCVYLCTCTRVLCTCTYYMYRDECFMYC